MKHILIISLIMLIAPVLFGFTISDYRLWVFNLLVAFLWIYGRKSARNECLKIVKDAVLNSK